MIKKIIIFSLFLSVSAFADMDCSKLTGKFISYSQFWNELVQQESTVIFKQDKYVLTISDMSFESGFTCDPDEGKIVDTDQRNLIQGYYNSEADILLFNGIWYHR